MYKVLIIEDDPFLNRAYQTILRREGFEVDSADDGVFGLEKANAIEPDLILLDMLMPQLGGLEFLRIYKPKELHPNVKVIVFSNMSVPESIEEAMELGAIKYMTKSSFSPKEMVTLIKDTLGATDKKKP